MRLKSVLIFLCISLISLSSIVFVVLHTPIVHAQGTGETTSNCVVTKVGNPAQAPNLPPGCEEEAGGPPVNCSGLKCALNYMVKTTNITSPFGPRGGGMHNGIDLAPPGGTPIRALEGGTVIELTKGCANVRSGCGGGGGNYVRIKDKNGRKHTYMHMASSPNVTRNKPVQRGKLLGPVGTSGDSTGPHLHYEISSPNGPWVNPVNALAKWPNY